MLPKGFAGIKNDAKRLIRSEKYVYSYSDEKLIISNGDIAVDVTSVMGPEARTVLHTELLNVKNFQEPRAIKHMEHIMGQYEKCANEEFVDSKVRLAGDVPLAVLVPVDSGSESSPIMLQQRYLDFASKVFDDKLLRMAVTKDRKAVVLYKEADFVGVIAPVVLSPESELVALFKRAAESYSPGGVLT